MRAYYTPLPAGTELWHIYPDTYAPLDFNPKSRNRFSVPSPGGRAMYYAASSPSVALWETVLRNLIVDRPTVAVDAAMLSGRRNAHVVNAEELPIIELRSPHFRYLSDDAAEHAHWQRMCVVPEADYALTHSCARSILAEAPQAAGIRWASRQMSEGQALVFYDPPAYGARFEVLDDAPVPARPDLIDAALAVMGVERLDASVLAEDMSGSLP